MPPPLAPYSFSVWMFHLWGGGMEVRLALTGAGSPIVTLGGPAIGELTP